MIGTVLGRLGKDAELTTSSGGTQYVKFTLAENVFRNGKDETIWYEIVSYDPFVLKYQIKALKKGSLAIVMGDVDSKVNVGKNGGVYLNTSITATNIKIPYLGNGEKKSGELSESSVPATNEKPVIAMPETKKTKKNVEPPQPQIPEINVSEEVDDDLPF